MAPVDMLSNSYAMELGSWPMKLTIFVVMLLAAGPVLADQPAQKVAASNNTLAATIAASFTPTPYHTIRSRRLVLHMAVVGATLTCCFLVFRRRK